MVGLLSSEERRIIGVQRRIKKLREMQLKVSAKRLKLNEDQSKIINELEALCLSLK